MVTVHFVDPNKGPLPVRTTVRAPAGSSIVDVAKEHGVDIHAACKQKLQCATCHVILNKSFYELLQPPGAREDDLLDSTFTLTPTSRLGCQVRLVPELDGIECTLPDAGAKGRVRMSLEQPRPLIRPQYTSVPAVAPRPRRDDARTSAVLKHHEDELDKLRAELAQQRDISANLESELRQLRSRQQQPQGRIQPAAQATEGSNSGNDGEADESLAKLKAELQATRVDTKSLGRGETFDDVIGLDEAKTALREAVIWPAIAHPALFSGIRGRPRGLLMYGPPGCGKTMLARAAAAELDSRAAFFHVRPSDVMSKFYGESQRRVAALENLVREAAPSVVFFDEVDSLLGSRDAGGSAEHHRATTNALLAWMDGFGTGTELVFFLGATNRAEAIDEAALRRFGDAVEVGAPSQEARLALLRHLVCVKAAEHAHQVSLTDAELTAISAKTQGFSLADLDRLVRRAFMEVLRQLPAGVHAGLHPVDVPPVTATHFDSALSHSSGTSALRKMLQQQKAANARA